jgi:hypothetical protein
MRTLALFTCIVALSGCDRISQRLWNCSSNRLDVLKTIDTGNEIVESIQAHSWIASMKGGAQIIKVTVTDGSHAKVVWSLGQPVVGTTSDAAPEVCKGQTGIAVQQL